VSARNILIGLAAALVFALGLAIDPAALAQWTWYCGSGGCGVRPVWLAAFIGGGFGGLMLLFLIRRVSARRSARRRIRSGATRKSVPKQKAQRPVRRKTRARA
jgi:hypothetical protein